MASDPGRRYTNIQVLHKGALLTEENQVRISRDFGNKEVITTARGFAGVVKGAALMRISIRNAVPAKGIEFDPGPAGYSATAEEFTFIRGSQTMTGRFIIVTDETSHQANNESELSFDLIGPLVQWEQL